MPPVPDALTPEEHARAEYIAYFIAWFRGGEKVPPYDPALAHRDFCMAAGIVLGQREPVIVRGQTSQMLPDGTHSFPIETVLGADGSSIPRASGEIAWSARDGVTFRIEFPHASRADAVPSPHGMAPPPPKGSLSDVSDTASWSGTIVEGGSFALFGAGGNVNTIHSPVDVSYVSRSIVTGKASFATVDLPINHPMAFRHDTPNLRREFLPSFDLLPWPNSDDVKHVESGTYHSRMRNLVVLQAEPRLTIYRGSSPGTDRGVWVVDEGPALSVERLPTDAAEDARGFLSFLVGRNLQFYWRDTFKESSIRRLYFGSLRPHAPVLGNEQPVPLYGVKEAYSLGSEIATRLQPLFARFRAVSDDYNLDFVLSPIWTALDGYVDDKLAEVCVSLERLATAHADYLKNSGKGKPKVEFLTKAQSTALIDALKAKADEMAVTAFIPADVLRIVKNKLDNVHQPPNADKLEVVFTDVGLTLRKEEEDALGNRNRALHGRKTLKGLDLVAVADELQRFDVLRTLIYKAALRLIDYTGPYMDYGVKTPGMGYSIQYLAAPAKT